MDAEEKASVEETLRREKALLAALVENVPEGIAIVSPGGKIIYYNHHFLSMWKLPPEVIERAEDGEAVQWAAGQTADPEAFLARIKEVYGTPEAVVEEEVPMKDGRILWRFGTPVSEAGVHLGWLWTFRDMTERLAVERKLRHLSQSLEERVEERTRALELQSERLRHLASELASAEHRERKRLAAVLHDDLQQLLVAANMALGTVRRRLKEERDRVDLARVAEWVSQASTAARELAHELRPPALYEDGLPAALRWLASRMLERHRIRVTIRNHRPLPLLTDEINALLFDSTRELLFNVAKYAGVDRATISLWDDGKRVFLAVEDKGVGFSMKSRSGRDGKEGGIGLFGIRERLVGLGGEVQVESRKGRGTRVVLAVPLDIAEKRTGEWIKPVISAPTGTEVQIIENGEEIRVLVVDDHELVRQGIANILRREKGILVVGEAADGFAAIEAVETMHPQVVLMDINMPRMNGIEATREIHRRWPEKIVIGLSVQDDDATRTSMFVSGAQDFLSKSGTADSMVSTIHKLIGR